ncbi:btb poz fold [Fusarium coicis]|nr:btb poz fold [Fusarium coicis]
MPEQIRATPSNKLRSTAPAELQRIIAASKAFTFVIGPDETEYTIHSAPIAQKSSILNVLVNRQFEDTHLAIYAPREKGFRSRSGNNINGPKKKARAAKARQQQPKASASISETNWLRDSFPTDPRPTAPLARPIAPWLNSDNAEDNSGREDDAESESESEDDMGEGEGTEGEKPAPPTPSPPRATTKRAKAQSQAQGSTP